MAHRKRKVKVYEEDLTSLTKEELIDHIQRLIAHNFQLKNVINKNVDHGQHWSENPGQRKFDFSKCPRRHIFIKLLYLGWDYQGYATQEETSKTIEWELFKALKRSCLIEERARSNYHRCGRTDKGVSAFGQVISIDVRTKLVKNKCSGNEVDGEMPSYDVHVVEETEGELEYCKILNRLLPPSIRAIAWSPALPRQSARFNCIKRTYKYFFPRGNLDIQRMVTAAEHLVGEHDFRNLCKMDVGNGVINFRRRILSVSIKVLSEDQLAESSGGSHGKDKIFAGEIVEPVNCEVLESIGDSVQSCANPSTSSCTESLECGPKELSNNAVSDRKQSLERIYDMCELTIVGKAFLWHQIRSIMTVLFLIGQGKEEPDVIRRLLDVDNFPRKPQYTMASEIPLNLFASDFESTLNWVYDRSTILYIIKDLQKEWTMLSVRSAMIKQMISELGSGCDDVDGSELTNCLLKGVRPRSYVPLLQREKCNSLESKIDHYAKKRRIDV
ncbi:tRNA pseudouridine(38/39) synthase [Ischnura elegans]|uniref:tRNA pseudouridine(38/39) synthase n=1 Tax=Ischnura elegans TaxID=197161 RepID=UPI001ED87233|nr:tRNA pseudouridine(38/39) synthase [Ischnura elegans]